MNATTQPKAVDFTKTSLHLLQLIDETEQQELAVHAVQAEAPEALPAQLSLLGVPPKALLSGWWVAEHEGAGLMGAVICTPQGKTNEVIGYDPRSRRILTKSLSVYELGLPQASFAAHGRQFLRQIGW